MASLIVIYPSLESYLLIIFPFSGAMLKCSLHKCPSSCHQLFNHSKILCRTVLTQNCPNGHNQSWQCHAGTPPACSKCERERKDAVKRAQKALEARRKQDEMTERHLKELEKIDEQMELLNQSLSDSRLGSEQQAILAQKRADLAAAKDRVNSTRSSRQEHSPGASSDADSKLGAPAPKKPPQHLPQPVASTKEQHSKLRKHIKTANEHNKSRSKVEWQRQKDQEKAHNPAIDKIMEMIGLEEVKAQILRIKAKVDTSIRQGTDLRKERLGLVLLGNPGTGMFSPSDSC